MHSTGESTLDNNFICYVIVRFSNAVHFSFSDEELCKDWREPTGWFYVPWRMEGPCQILRELANRRGITTASCCICLDIEFQFHK